MTNSISGQAREARVSVNLDIANLPAEAAATIMREAASYGRVVTARAFADFRRNDLGDLPVQLFQLGFQLVHCPSWPNGGGRLKSVVDSILAQDLRDQAENDPLLDVFILGSGDRDFLAVVHALRRHGRKVIIASTADASNRSLLATVDGYIQLQAPERHTFNVPTAQMYSPQPPAAVYTGPVTALPAPPPQYAVPAPSRQAMPAPVAPPQRQQRRSVERVAQAPVTPMVQDYVPAAPAVVHPMQPRRQATAAFRSAPEPRAVAPAPAAPPEVAAPAPVAAQETHVPLTAATLHEQILQMVTTRPQVTPRQVLQALAPRGEPTSARRRQAVGDAIAQLVQSGRLVRRTEMVRGRPADILMTSEMAATAPPAAPLDDALFEVMELDEEPAAPVVETRPSGRTRSGDRRGNGRTSASYRAPRVQAEPSTAPEPELEFAAAEVEVEKLPYRVVVEESPGWAEEPAVVTAVDVPFQPEPEVEDLGPAVPAARSAPAPRRTAASARQPAAIEPVRPVSRFRAPVFTQPPAVAEAPAPDEAPPATAPAAVVAAPATEQHPAAEAAMDAVRGGEPVTADASADTAADEAASAAPRRRSRSRRRPSATSTSETAAQDGNASEPANETAPAL